ncbi:MAG: dTMP kinase [Bryobacteraceae bacterium]|nr:dTMP kinase [Bryobacteraceae bacterium]
MTRRPVRFISFEGPDGGGKSTQIKLLIERLRSLGWTIVETAEPGGTAIGQQIRQVLLDGRNQELSPVTELLLYFASRAQNVDERIRPALEQGALVIADRYTDSTLVYQGWGRGLGEDVVRQLHAIACRGVEPQLTICLDVDLDVSAKRRGARAEADRLEQQSREFHQRVRDGYLRLAIAEPERIKVIDASRPIEEVAADVWRVVEAAL